MCSCSNKSICRCGNRKALELLGEAIRCLEAACSDIRCGNRLSARNHICWAIDMAQKSLRHI